MDTSYIRHKDAPHRSRSIGVFDSGFGGLSVLRGIVNRLPHYNYIYLGDSARAPYGSRSKDIVYDFTREAVDFLFKNDCQIIVLACNTASSDALRKIQQGHLTRYYPDRKVLGVLIPAAEEAVIKTRNKRVGIIATEGTVRSGSFERELNKLDPDIEVFSKACPLLVPIVEAGEHRSKIAEMILADYLKPLLEKDIDTLILGCTHYVLLEDIIKKMIGPNMSIISEAEVVPKKLESYLDKHKEIELSKDGLIDFYSTDLTEKFDGLGSEFFGKKIQAKNIDNLNN